MERTKWVERSFDFDFPEGILSSILERLRGTEHRMRVMTRNLSELETSARTNDKWSVKEQIGHLVDLEDLHISRLEQMIARKPELTAADMANRMTEQASHNEKSIESLIEDFATKRKVFIDLLDSMDDETQLFSSLHPRLNVKMRPIDVAFFTAEHDDHHLASVREIIERQSS
ncbi:MAG: DinB family protein [Cyclobacteriaceae bacterium]